MPRETSERAARRLSRPLLRLSRLIVATWLFLCGGTVLLLAAGWLIIDNRWRLIGLLPVLAAWLWAGWSVWRVVPATAEYLKLDPKDAPELKHWCDDVAAELEVPPADFLALSARPDVCVWSTERATTLVIGVPSLWHLSVEELRSSVAPMLACAVLERHPRVRRARALSAKIRTAYAALPASLAWSIRGAVNACDLRTQRLDAEVDRWGQIRASARGFPQVSAETQVAAEGWDHLLSWFVFPAYRRGRWPEALGHGLRDLIAAFDAAGPLARDWDRRGAGSAALLLGEHAVRIDRRFSTWMAARNGVNGEPLRWADYVSGVIEPGDRELAAELVGAVSLVEGSAVPAGVEEVLRRVDRAGLAVGAVLAGGRTLSGPARVDTDDALAALDHGLRAFVTTALVDAGIVRRRLDWLRGARAVGVAEDELAVRDHVHAAIVNRDIGALRHWLLAQGLVIDEPVLVSGTEGMGPFRYVRPLLSGVLARWFGGLATLGLHDHRLLLLTNDMQPSARRLLAEQPDTVAIPLRDVVDVRFKASWFVYWWRCVIQTSERRLVLRGFCSTTTYAAAQLGTVFGDRLVGQRVRRDDATGRWSSLTVRPVRNLVGVAALWIGVATIGVAAAIASVAATSTVDSTTVVDLWTARPLPFVGPLTGAGTRTTVNETLFLGAAGAAGGAVLCVPWLRLVGLRRWVCGAGSAALGLWRWVCGAGRIPPKRG